MCHTGASQSHRYCAEERQQSELSPHESVLLYIELAHQSVHGANLLFQNLAPRATQIHDGALEVSLSQLGATPCRSLMQALVTMLDAIFSATWACSAYAAHVCGQWSTCRSTSWKCAVAASRACFIDARWGRNQCGDLLTVR